MVGVFIGGAHGGGPHDGGAHSGGAEGGGARDRRWCGRCQTQQKLVIKFVLNQTSGNMFHALTARLIKKYLEISKTVYSNCMHFLLTT